MTCEHYAIDQSQSCCDRCADDRYLDTPFTMNDHNYTVWSEYGTDSVTGERYYQCRRDDGSGAIYLTTSDIDGVL